MKTPIFVSFCLLIVSLLVSLHTFFKDAFNPGEQLKAKIARIDKEKRDADFRAQLLQYQLSDYQQNVATLMPQAVKGKTDEASYSLRQLASVSREGTGELDIERASGLFEDAKAAFREKDYEESNHLLARLIQQYPASVHVVEAHFLLAEGQYQQKDFVSAIVTIEKMIDLFPENELTGFALLRLGHIYENQERLEDASDIYKAVLANFSQPVLIKQARASLQAVTL